LNSFIDVVNSNRVATSLDDFLYFPFIHPFSVILYTEYNRVSFYNTSNADKTTFLDYFKSMNNCIFYKRLKHESWNFPMNQTWMDVKFNGKHAFKTTRHDVCITF